jgi:esterase/lipase superfamily enzyme
MNLIQNLAEKIGNQGEFHIIAHSMGNEVVMGALEMLFDKNCAIQKLLVNCNNKFLSEYIMIAPDVDLDVYKSIVPRVISLTKGMTLYASVNDKALIISKTLSNFPRAGLIEKSEPVMIEGVDSIDVSVLGEDMLAVNHNVPAQNRSALSDIGRIINDKLRLFFTL